VSLSSRAISHPVTTVMISICVIILGVVALQRLRIDLLPDLDFPSISIYTTYEGVGPEEIENLVTRPIEEAVGTVPNVERIESVSLEGRSRISLRFSWGTRLDTAIDDVRTRVERVRDMLPEDADTPTVFSFDVSAFPVMFMGVAGSMEPFQMRQFVEKTVKYRLERLDGVASVNIRGGFRREIQVNLDAERLEASGISPVQVVTALKRANRNIAGGVVEESASNVLVRTMGEFEDLDMIRNVVVASRVEPGTGNEVPVRVSDVAEVVDGHEEITNIARLDGIPGIRLSINKQSDANTVEVSERVHAELRKLNKEFKDRIHIQVMVDTADFIKDSITSVQLAVLYGSCLALLVLLVFLYNVRSTLVIGIAIPIAVMATFGGMYFFDMTLNMISFGGLALGIGMLVDSAIVIHENIFRQVELGRARKEAAVVGSDEVGPAIIASTMTTISVFAPVLFLGGFAAVFFKEMAFVVTIGLTVALVSALTLVPVLSVLAMGGRRGLGAGRLAFMERAVRSLEAGYGWVIARVIRHPVLVIAGATLALTGSVLLVPLLGFELMPEADEGHVRVNVDMPVGTRIEDTNRVMRKVEGIVVETVPELDRMTSLSGVPGWWSRAGEESGSMRLVMHDPPRPGDRDTDEIALELRSRILPLVPGGRIRVRPSEGFFLMRMLRGGGERLEVMIRGYDLEDAARLGRDVSQIMERVEGVTDVRVSRREGNRELRLYPNPYALAQHGLDITQLGDLVATYVAGAPAGYYRDAGDEYTIRVRLTEEDRIRPDRMLEAPVFLGPGQSVSLRQLVSERRDTGPIAIERENQERVVVVSGDMSGERDLGSIVRDLRRGLDGLEMPRNFTATISGEYEEQQETFGTLLGGLVLAILLVYMVMASLYESLLHPLLILLCIPLALGGVLVTLFVTGTTLNIESLMGAIVLVGIVVNNAIVLVDYTNLLRRRDGMDLTGAVILAGKRRLRPILMTALTTGMALMPVALAIGRGTETQAPMARAVVGGLLIGTIVTLLVLPSLYHAVEAFRLRRGARRLKRGSGLEAGRVDPVE
jgi:HAE1 family hydrophobic/amphiphilic exporter-1